VLVAAEAGAPVVPVTIRGTRSILRDGHWFPRRGIITVTIGKPDCAGRQGLGGGHPPAQHGTRGNLAPLRGTRSCA